MILATPKDRECFAINDLPEKRNVMHITLLLLVFLFIFLAQQEVNLLRRLKQMRCEMRNEAIPQLQQTEGKLCLLVKFKVKRGKGTAV